jgi:acylphosphatase
MDAVRIRVAGDQVAAAAARARELGLQGWARIAEDDRAVTAIHAEGDGAAMELLVASLDGAPEVERVRAEGHEQFAVRGVAAGRFTVTGGDDDGYALALEVDGAPRVWRLRKAPSMDPADKRGATVPKAAGAGWPEGAVWDAGDYEQGGRVAWPEAIDRGHAVFVLRGEKLQGGFALQRTRPPLWLLIKRRDAYAAGATPK